jgi:hypothetical protein
VAFSNRWFEFSYSGKGTFTWVQEPLYDVDGEIVPLFVACSSPVYMRVRDTKPIGDRVRFMGGQLIVSSRALEVMCQLRFDSVIRRRPVCVTRRGEIITDILYYWLDSSINNEVLEESLSVFSRSPVTGKPLVITKWVLDEDRIPDCDLFTGNIGVWFCSDRLRNSIHENGLTNFGFEEVEVSGQ